MKQDIDIDNIQSTAMPFREVMFSYFYSLYQYVRTAWPVSIIYGPPLVPPTQETRQKLLKVIFLLKCSEDKVSEIFSLLQTLPPDEDWLNVAEEETGYDVLQHAVLCRRKDVILYLLSKGCDPNRYHCSPPIHLAAYIGDDHTLEMLFDMGAKANLKRGICYPEPHVPISYEARYFSYTQHPVYLCRTHKMTPVQCAIHRNNLACVQTILKKEGIGHKGGLSPHALLMQACKEGAADCIRYFVDEYPGCINSYLDGDTPLLAAVPWGEECAKLLLDNGADVHLRSEGIQETALHRLYRQNIDGLFTIYDTTKYLLTTGIEQEVNAYTHLGETPLHMLISHVSYTGGNYVDPQRQIPRNELQESYQTQVLAAIELLLKFNADPHLLNSPGLTSLSRLLHISLKAVHRTDLCECVQTSQPNMFISDYRLDYRSLSEAMEILLKFEAQPNYSCEVGHTPLILMLQLLLYDDLGNICSQHEAVVESVKVLLDYDADANFTDGGQGTAYTLIAALGKRCFHPSTVQGEATNVVFDGHRNPPQSLREHFANVVNDVLAAMLSYKLVPNVFSHKITQHLWGGNGNGFIEFIRLAGLATSSFEFEQVGKWILTLLQWGGDPDLEPYSSEPIICHCQSSIFLKKLGTQPISHLIHELKDKEDVQYNTAMKQLLMLFYNSMDHKVLHDCLSATKSFIHLQPRSRVFRYTAVSSSGDGNVDFLSLVNIMSENPRSLKEIARVAIYKSLNRKLAMNVEALPLPGVVKRYLLDVCT